MTEAKSEALMLQCAVQAERCLYTSTTLFVWVRTLRLLRILYVVLPIIFGALAGWNLLRQNPEYATLTAFLALVAGMVPAIYAALKLDEHLPKAARLAGEYKNLEIIFADLEKVGLLRDFESYYSEYLQARSRIERLNTEAYTAPEWCFQRARKKIRQNHYKFDGGS